MRFTETRLGGSFVIDFEQRDDSRGFFARAFCQREFESHGLKPVVAQCNCSFNHMLGTLRGMHYQIPPVAETKLVRCTRGAIYDVIVDLRPQSPTYLQHVGVELTERNHRQLYVPELFAHGYLTLTPDAEVVYQVGEFYTPGYERGIRYDDPALKIKWPIAIELLSEKDASWPRFEPERRTVDVETFTEEWAAGATPLDHEQAALRAPTAGASEWSSLTLR